ncbi:hypothetical protein B0H63DRAFT_438488 [Podospora didyma]|uniref:Uncharacterized protein n=1 Tax=Podospora didyma TaxID=330526 RepID=A0AAE0N9K5_9PEZI|nr:hypothetical protein B0H63DRAFT_438488 [Podospora didyma]
MASPVVSRSFGSQFLLLVRSSPATLCKHTQRPAPIRLVLYSSQTATKARPAMAPPPGKPAKAKTGAVPRPASSAKKNASSPILGNAAAAAAVAARRTVSSFAEQLAAKGTRTILYEAPSHFWYRFSCLSAGTFCVSYAVYQYWTIYLNPSEGLAWWVPQAFFIVCAFMASMGGYFALGTSRIVRSIESAGAAAAAQAATAAAATAAAASTPIYIEVSTRRVLPFLPPKRTLLLPAQVSLPFQMHRVLAGEATPLSTTKHLSVAAQRAEREAKAKARQYELDHIMTAPFRDAKSGMNTAWSQVRRAFDRGGFAKIRLKGVNYKIDVTGGWALDNGRAMDRLLTVRQRL